MAVLKKDIFPSDRLRATQVGDIISIDGKTYSVVAGLRPLLVPWEYGLDEKDAVNSQINLKSTSLMIASTRNYDSRKSNNTFRSFSVVIVNTFCPYKGKVDVSRFSIENNSSGILSTFHRSYSGANYGVGYSANEFKLSGNKIGSLNSRGIFSTTVYGFPGSSYYNYSFYKPVIVVDTTGKFGKFVLNDFPVYQSRNKHSYLVLLEGVRWPSLSASRTLLKYDYITGIPVLIGESKDSLYIYNSSASIKQASLLKIEQTGNKSLVANYTQASFPMSISSIISKPKKDDNDEVFHWYKFVYDATTDDSGNTVYIPKLAYCTYDPATDETNVVYEDCSVELPEELDLQNYLDSDWGCGCHVVNVEEVEKDGQIYLLVMVMNMGQVAALTPTYNNHYGFDSKAFIQSDAMKMHLFSVDGSDPKKLTYVGSKDLPWDTIYIAPPKEDGAWVEDGFIIWSPYRVLVCSLTFDENVFEIKNAINVPDGSYIKAFGNDGHRLYVLLTNDNLDDVSTNVEFWVWGNEIPEDVKIVPEKDYYDYQGEPIDSYANVDVVNYKNERISAKVRLRILTNNAVFKDTNSSTIEITTSATDTTQVQFTITNEGSIKVAVEAIKVL